MAEAFLGLVIAVQLHSGLKLSGTVAHIEPASQQMTLKDVELEFPGQPPHFTSVYGVNGNEIVDLQVIQKKTADKRKTATSTTTTATAKTTTTIVPKTSKSCNVQSTVSSSRKKTVEKKSSNDRVKSIQHKKNNMPVKSLSSCRKQQQQQQQQQQRIPGITPKENGWANEDVNGFREKEFDFQANLDMFDKAKVFAEIRELDDTTSDTLLVTLNRLPQKQQPPRKNLLPTENVLDDESEADESIGDESDTESRTTSDESTRGRRRHKKRTVVVASTTPSPVPSSSRLRTLDSHIDCVVVSPLQMAHAEHECVKMTGPSEDQLIENGGRCISLKALQILDIRRRKDDQVVPVVIVLAGNNKIGANGLSAARHLINRGYHVAVCMNEERTALCDTVAQQQTMIEQAGGKLINDPKVLQHWTADLIIDAMTGTQQFKSDGDDDDDGEEAGGNQALREMIHWASEQATPVLSIDFPSAVGDPHTDAIHPQWTVCLGAPKSGCVSQDVTGELYMADIGIPKICWKRAGVKGWTAPWGADFLVALEYVI
ncbi:YjeF N-terminal domain-containing protein [Zychaea mexicana]|uniref:YjeF N-terminal domain-containing protein n=1 Tax=Zychaea mexicana TaxID=64656 RepID=UPI0022FED5E3|nr:YjeF N-terminal domain-containing protein [Zychaea mexicana]KAI9499411.1 YjeF N-terminal domain-containing protein [Zychaea mexicana]